MKKIIIVGVAMCVVSLAGCGGGSGSSTPTPPPPANAAPGLSGTPVTKIDQDANYSFAPTATDPDGDSLSFTIANAPSWLSIDAATGQLSGTPVQADIGRFDNLILSVFDGELTTALAPFSIEVLQIWNLVLSGIATDSPVANAEIEIIAATMQFNGTADATGSFSIPVSLRSGDFDDDSLVKITALGTASQAHVELVTQVGSIGNLIAQAGADEMLGSDQNKRLNVTQLSTSRYLLAIDGNGGIEPANIDELSEVENVIDTERLLKVAGIIKLIVDGEFTDLPEGQTVIGMLSGVSGETTNLDAVGAFLYDSGVRPYDPSYEGYRDYLGALEQAIADTVSNAAIVGDLDPQVLIGSTVWTKASQQNRVPDSGVVLDFAADGSGISYENIDDWRNGFEGDMPDGVDFTWAAQDGVVNIEVEFVRGTSFPFMAPPYSQLVFLYGFDSDVADYLTQRYDDQLISSAQVAIRQTVTSKQIYNVSLPVKTENLTERLHVNVQTNYSYDIDDFLLANDWVGELPRTTGVLNEPLVVYAGDSMTNVLAAEPQAGEVWATPIVYRPTLPRLTTQERLGLHTDMFTLGSSNATSQGVLSGLSFQWSADAEGLTLESADERYQIKPIDNDGRMMFALITQWVDGEIKFRTAEWVARGDGLGDQLVADLPQTLPRYWQGGVGTYLAAHSDSDGELLSSSVFGYSFEENGMSDRVFSDPLQCEEESFELYCGAIFDPDDREWAWTHDGGTIVRESESSERLRTWEIVSYQPGGRAILLESETYRPNNQGEFEVLIYPRLNSIELRDLSEWPEEWAASAPNFEN